MIDAIPVITSCIRIVRMVKIYFSCTNSKNILSQLLLQSKLGIKLFSVTDLVLRFSLRRVPNGITRRMDYRFTLDVVDVFGVGYFVPGPIGGDSHKQVGGPEVANHGKNFAIPMRIGPRHCCSGHPVPAHSSQVMCKPTLRVVTHSPNKFVTF